MNKRPDEFRRLAWTAWIAAASVLLPASASVCEAAGAAPEHSGHAAEATSKPARKPRIQLGAAAAFDAAGRLWAVRVADGHVWLSRSDDLGTSWGAPVKVNAEPERISADGELRPKLAIGAAGEIFVAWTRALARPYSGDIRYARSGDGARFDAPLTVHRDRAEITHRFESMLVDGEGRVWVSWVDKRDLEADLARHGAAGGYRGAAIYAARSEPGGARFEPEFKVADHSCECCRIALARDADGGPLALWRHVFAPNERDHAIARLDAIAATPSRATFDAWRIDACPHHGPALAVAGDGTRHAVWFNPREGEPRAHYGRLREGAVEGQMALPDANAEHADLALSGERVAVVWTTFDGNTTGLSAWVSPDGGRSGTLHRLASTAAGADHARALSHGGRLYAFWHTEREGFRLMEIAP